LVSSAAVAALLDAGEGRPTAARLLDFVNRAVPVEHLSMVEFGAHGPELVGGCTVHASGRDVVAECFAIYRQRYFRSDAITPIAAQAAHQPARRVVAVSCRADELPLRGWRDDIYVREGLTERFSLLHAPSPGRVAALHLYRDVRQGLLQQAELDWLLAVAPLLRQAHALAPELSAGAACADPLARALRLLAQRAPQLSPRELAVCARIACGIGVDGIAADLGIAPSTVVTLRKRAYLKLREAGLPAQRLGLAQWVGRAAAC
jgi:DNA-binding CsgD family transcriptional regulator